MRWLRTLFLLALATLPLDSKAGAQEKYPSRMVKIIVGFPPGSSADILGRVYAQKLSEIFGQPFIVENRPGASSNMATEMVTRATPDGYTVSIGSTANTISTNTLDLKFDFAKDLSPIIGFASAPTVLMVSAKLGVSNVKDFVKYAKEHPGKVAFGSSGTWSGPHMAGELFSMVTGANLNFIPYQATPNAVNDMLGGQIPAAFVTSPPAAGFVNDDRVKVLAVTADKRSSLIPDVPTMQEQGVNGVDTSIWYGFFAPKNTPLAVRKIFADAVMKINEMPDVQEVLKNNGTEPMAISLDALSRYVDEDTSRWKSVVDAVKARTR
jgi:tripartite-type tricarboxylate transporter receptor subunit TctC